MAKSSDAQAMANRIRAAAQSLRSQEDIATVRDYLTELELIAARQEAEDLRPRVGAEYCLSE